MGSRNLEVFFGEITDEALVARHVFEKGWVPVHDRNLGPKAQASVYQDEIRRVLAEGRMPVLVDLENDLPDDPLNFPKEKIELSGQDPKDMLANLDDGDVSSFVRPEAVHTPEGSIDVDRVIGMVKDMYSREVAEALEQARHIPRANNLSIVKLPHNGTSILMDRLQDWEKQNLLVISGNGQLNYFGNSKLCEILKEKFGGWNGESQWIGPPDKKTEFFIIGYCRGELLSRAEELLAEPKGVPKGNELIGPGGEIVEGDIRGKVAQFKFSPNSDARFKDEAQAKLAREDIRFKKAVIGDGYHGTLPQPGEEWICRISGDTKHGSPHTGVAFLWPLGKVEGEKHTVEAAGVPVRGVVPLRAACYRGIERVKVDDDFESNLNIFEMIAESEGAYEGKLRKCGLRVDWKMAYSNPEIKGSFSTDVSKFPGTTNLEITDYKLILEKLGEPGLVENLDKGMFRLHFGNTIAFVTAETLIKAGVPHTFDLESVDRPSFMSDDVKVDVDFPGFGKTYFIVGHGATGRSETHLTNLEAVGRPMYISEACPDEIKPKAIEFLKRNGHVLLDAIIAQRVEGVYRNALRMHKAAMEKLEQGFDDVVFKGICRKHSYSQYRDVYYAAFELHHEEGDPSEIQLELSREDWTSAGEEGKQDVKGQHKFFFETFIKSIRGIFSHADQFLSLVDEFREAADLEVYRVDADDSHHRGREAEYHELIAQEKARAAELLWSCEEELATMP